MSRRPAPSSTPTNREVLELFVVLADELAGRRLIQVGFSNDLVIRGGGAPPSLSVTSTEPDEEDFRSMLMALRKFLAQGEPTHIFRVYGVIERTVTDPGLVEDARCSRSILQGARDGATAKPRDAAAAGPAVYVDGTTPEAVLDMFVDGVYFHSDPAARARVDALPPDAATLMRHQARQYAIEAVRQVGAVSNIIRAAKASGAIPEGAAGLARGAPLVSAEDTSVQSA